jgi:peptidoglycan/LPS O-acetylase OafA/YrhL
MTIAGPAPANVRLSPVRPDIQGLRAVAVLAVLAHHLFGWPAGGYVGVDVFFVISGFLITGLLLREIGSSGRVSLGNFYRRRARRILPAATVCLAVTVAAAWLVFRSARFDSIADDASWSLLLVSNWHFAAAGADYLGAIAPVSPLQHYWSLAVEEQFYLCWPPITVAIVGLSQLRGVQRTRVGTILAGVLVIVVICTFLLAVFETVGEPTWAYFSTLSRVWELAAGALLAASTGGVRAGGNCGSGDPFQHNDRDSRSVVGGSGGWRPAGAVGRDR